MVDENYIPSEDDISPELAVTAAIDGMDAVASLLDQQPDEIREKLERAFEVGAGAEVIKEIRREYREIMQIRLEFTANQALNTLQQIMSGFWIEPKTASAAQKAAEAVLDRGGFPKVSRRLIDNSATEPANALPPLNEILEKAQPEDRARLTEDYLEAIRRLDAMRQGAREVIDVRPGNQAKSAG